MTRHWWQLSVLLLSSLSLATACTGIIGVSQEDTEITETGDPEVDGPELTPFSTHISLGTSVEVINVKFGLNCRTGPSTGYMIVTILPRGAKGTVLAQSSSRKWYKLAINGKRCWAYHYYLTPASGTSAGQSVSTGSSCHAGAKFGWTYCSASCPCGAGEGDCDTNADCKTGLVCARDVGTHYGVKSTVDVCQKSATSAPAGPATSATSNSNGFVGMRTPYVLSRNRIINAAKAFVGFSYWRGGAKLPKPWETSGKDNGKCWKTGDTFHHNGSWGADCSGFVCNVWQLPEAISFETNRHAFNTSDFRYHTTHWSNINRSAAQRGDAMVYRGSKGGHIVIFAGGDPWGSLQTYEARNCKVGYKGIVYNTRTLSTSYQARRRNGI